MSDAKVATNATLQTDRVTLVRYADRGRYDLKSVTDILDQAFLCHVGFEIDGQPYIIPTYFGREGNRLYIHGSSASRMLRHAAKEVPVCVTVTIVDGLILARSAFFHDMNYRSAVILGKAVSLEGDEKLRALEVMAEHLLPGRWKDVRAPNSKELLGTCVISVDIKEASAKVRQGPPVDNEEDMDQPCWAGEIPLFMAMRPPVVDPQSRSSHPLPTYIPRLRGVTAIESPKK